jgi:hypothetical protein
MEPCQWESSAGAVGGARIDLFMAPDDRISVVHFADSLSQVANQFVERQVLIFRGYITVEVADKTNTERYIIQIVAMHMSTIELPRPAITDFDLAISGGAAIADDEMVCEAIRHFANVPMVIVKDSSVPLSGPAIMDNDIFPSIPSDAGSIDRLPNGRGKKFPSTAPFGRRDQVALRAGFLHNDRFTVAVPFSKKKPSALLFGRRRRGHFRYGRSFLGGRREIRGCDRFGLLFQWRGSRP